MEIDSFAAVGGRIVCFVAYSKLESMSLAEIRSQYREQIVVAAGRRSAHNIRIFGSVPAGRSSI